MKLEFLIPFIICYLVLWTGFYIFQRINFKNKSPTLKVWNFKNRTVKYGTFLGKKI